MDDDPPNSIPVADEPPNSTPVNDEPPNSVPAPASRTENLATYNPREDVQAEEPPSNWQQFKNGFLWAAGAPKRALFGGMGKVLQDNPQGGLGVVKSLPSALWSGAKAAITPDQSMFAKPEDAQQWQQEHPSMPQPPSFAGLRAKLAQGNPEMAQRIGANPQTGEYATRQNTVKVDPATGELVTDWPEWWKHAADVGTNVGGELAGDPLTAALPGVGALSGGRALASARIGAGAELAAGGTATGKWAGLTQDAMRGLTAAEYAAKTGEALPGAFSDAAAAQRWLSPTAQELIRKGMYGVSIAGGDVAPIPPGLAALARPFDWAASVKIPGMNWLTSKSASSVEAISERLAEGPARAAMTDYAIQKIKPMWTKAVAAGMSDDQVKTLGLLHDAGDIEAGKLGQFVLRGDKSLEGAEKLGLPVRATIDPAFKEQLAGLGDLTPAQRKALYEIPGKGFEHFDPQVNDGLARMSTWSDEHQALAKELLDGLAQIPSEQSAIYQRMTGRDPNILNKQILNRPQAIFDRLKELDDPVNTEHPLEPKVSSTKLYHETDPASALDALSGEPRRIYMADAPDMALGQGGRGAKLIIDRNAVTKLSAHSKPSQSPQMRAMGQEYVGNVPKDAVLGVVIESTTPELLDQIKALKLQSVETKDGLFVGKSIPAGAEERAALIDELPEALRKRNAVAQYRPGRVSGFAKDELLDKSGNPMLGRSGTGAPYDTAEKTLVHGKDYGDPALEGVKATVEEAERFYQQGTGATYSTAKSIPGKAALTWMKKFLTPKGLSEAVEAYGRNTLGKEFFEPNIFKSFADLGTQSMSRGIRNATLENTVRNIYATVPAEAVAAAKAEARRLELGSLAEGAEAAAEGELSPLESVQEAWERHGGAGSILEHLPGDAAAAVESGQMPVWEAFKGGNQTLKGWTPEGMSAVRLGDETHFVHTGVANWLNEYKALGTDPSALRKLLGNLVPTWTYGVRLMKNSMTWATPKLIAYSLRRLAQDGTQMLMAKQIDGMSMLEQPGMMMSLFEHNMTGDTQALRGFGVHVGDRVMDGENFLQLARDNNVLGHGELGADVFSHEARAQINPSVARTSEAVDAGKMSPMEDLGYGEIKPAEVVRKIKAFNSAREDTMRLSAFAAELRKGMSPTAAAVAVEKSLFDFSRIGPGNRFLRDSGIAPFVTYNIKAIPFAADWMLHNPGEFYVANKILDLVDQGKLQEQEAPTYAKDQYNVTWRRTVDKDGNVIAHIVTPARIWPVEDLSQFRTSVSKLSQGDMSGWEYWKQQLGPPAQMAFSANDFASKPNDRYTPLDVLAMASDKAGVSGGWGKVGQELKGLATGEANLKTGAPYSVGDLANTMLNPLRNTTVNATKQGVMSVVSANKEVKAMGHAFGDAERVFEEAKADWESKNGTANTAALISQEEAFLAPYVQKATAAKAKFDAALKTRQDAATGLDSQREIYQRMKLTP